MTNDEGAHQPLGTMLGLVAALALSMVALRWIAGPDVPFGGTAPRRTQQQMSAEPPVAPSKAGGNGVRTALTAGVRGQDLPRTYYANIAEAGQRRAMPVVQPAVLPPGAGLLSVAWQPDVPVVVPGDPDTGVLFAWYFTLFGGSVLTLEQGPGVGLSVAGAPADRHGEVLLPDGRRLLWARGHGEWVFDSLNPSSVWSGDELWVGVAPAGQAYGWRVRSVTLSLDELLSVAASVR